MHSMTLGGTLMPFGSGGGISSPTRHLVERLTYGSTPSELARADALGLDGYLREQLRPETIDDSECAAMIAPLKSEGTLEKDWDELYDYSHKEEWIDRIRPGVDVFHATLVRRAHSLCQLHERMIDFWHDHFNIYWGTDLFQQLLPKWDALLRQHALGNFGELLRGTAQHPCMLIYLDNYISTNSGPNENYARELLELHTLGAMHYQQKDGYADDDVYETSRCFTGWGVDWQDEVEGRGRFLYRHDNHDRFQKIVLDNQIPRDQDPLRDGLTVLDILASHPATAKHIAHKLCVRFVSDEPSEALVASAAEVFHKQRNAPDQIRQTLEHIFSSEEFRTAQGQKFKRPLEWFVSWVRATESLYKPSETDGYMWTFGQMGQPLFGWRTPDGAPDTAQHWATSDGLHTRWRFASLRASGWDDNLNVEYREKSKLDVPEDATPRKLASQVSDHILGKHVSKSTIDNLIDFAGDGRNPDLPLNQEHVTHKLPFLVAVCTMTPEFMRR